MSTLKSCTILLSILFTILFTGCVSSDRSSKPSGFLGEYPAFTKGADDIDLRYLKPGVDFKKYKRIMMDEVVFYFRSDSDYKGIQPSEIKKLGDMCHTIFVDTFGDMLTDKPGPDVIRMRLAITNIEPSNPVTGTLTTIVPVGLAVNLIKKGAGGEYTGIGSASAEVEFLDSLTNERIAAGIDKAPGDKLDVGELSPVETAFKHWASRLLSFMFEKEL